MESKGGAPVHSGDCFEQPGGLVYHGAWNTTQSIRDFERAAQINPEYAEAHYNLGIAYDAIGQRERALAIYTRALTLMNTFAVAFCRRSLLYYQTETAAQSSVKHFGAGFDHCDSSGQPSRLTFSAP